MLIFKRILHRKTYTLLVLKGVKECDKQQEECPAVEPQGSERTPLCSKLSERGV